MCSCVGVILRSDKVCHVLLPLPAATCCRPQVLAQFYDRHEEVPVVAMYRKELAAILLAMRQEEVPGCTTRDEADHSRGKGAKRHYQQGFVQPHHRRIRR